MLKRLKIYYLYVAFPFVLLLIGAAIFIDPIIGTLSANPHPQINYAIFCIILVGGGLILREQHRLMQEAKALAEFSEAMRDGVDQQKLQEMSISYDADIAYVLRMIAASRSRAISHQEQVAIEHELDKASARMQSRNALPQFLTGLLVGMGLLGTFIGLLSTLNDISSLIGTFAEVDMSSANPIDVFRTMIERMKAPMRSMGIAFSASLYGLLGSIILGFMMVGLRRCLGDILSILGSEVAQHVEFALAADGFAYSKTALRKQAAAGRAAAIPLETLVARGGAQGAAALGGSAGSEAEAGRVIEDTSKLNESTAKEPVRARRQQQSSEFEGEELRVLLRIEDRLVETTRLQSRALGAEIDDFNKQRADMLRMLAEHNEAVVGFKSELQRVGRQLGSIFSLMEKGNGEVVAQISELMVRMSDDAAETRLVILRQIEEQQVLAATMAESMATRTPVTA